jgi:histidine triad (HIT) family protein
MDCIFCKIVKGEIPAKKIYEDDHTLAFLDINPANPGHALVVPKKHSEDITHADDKDLNMAIDVVKKIVQQQKERLGAHGVNVIQNNGKQAGQLVAHLHFHVIPRFQGDMVVISYQRTQLSEAQLEEVRKKLSEEKSSVPDPKSFDMNFD